MATTTTEARIVGADPDVRPDDRDRSILARKYISYDASAWAKVGDWLRFHDGSYERFSHDWGDGLQTCGGGSFYLGDGYASFSGSLNPAIPNEVIRETTGYAVGRFWFFHHDMPRAHSAVYVEMLVRVWGTSLLPYR